MAVQSPPSVVSYRAESSVDTVATSEPSSNGAVNGAMETKSSENAQPELTVCARTSWPSIRL
jgi:hypothetical protein